MNLSEIIKNENVTLNIKSNDLTTFATDIINKVLGEKKEPPVQKGETYLTTEQLCETLSISRVTAYHWERKGILKPVRFGNLKRYRLSEIENIGA